MLPRRLDVRLTGGCPFAPRKIPSTNFCLKVGRLVGLDQLRSPITLSELEPANFGFVEDTGANCTTARQLPSSSQSRSWWGLWSGRSCLFRHTVPTARQSHTTTKAKRPVNCTFCMSIYATSCTGPLTIPHSSAQTWYNLQSLPTGS
jgi:hypothetical protein